MFAKFLRRLCCIKRRGEKQPPNTNRVRGLYSMAFRRNSPKRMRTLTQENQYQRLLESATPLSRHPYAVQLEIKQSVLEKALKKVVNIVKHNRRGQLSEDIEKMSEENQGCICPLLGMLPSPKQKGFRNKEELNIMLGADGDPNTVGLIIGRGENIICVPGDVLCNTKPLHNEVVKTFKSFLDQSKFKRRNPDSSEYTTHWSRVLIRSNEQGHVMLVPDLSCRELTQEAIDQAKEELTNFYVKGSQMLHGICSLHLRVRYRRSRMFHAQHFLAGESHIYENVLGYKFRISPQAFFQLNTPGSEVLYSVVQDLVKACHPQAVLDVGCGTGTISLMTSSLVQRVVGFDVVPEAVEDAEFNARLNNVNNCSFFVGSARRLLKSFLADGFSLTDDTVAVVNPNRNGLNKKAIQRLRCSSEIKHLIFISCKPHGNALVNFVDLIVPENEDHPGKPFRAVQATGVDMFPQTVHSELVVLFQR